MGDGCDCDDPELVAVKDREKEESYVSGNPYSRFCLNCRRRYFCKQSFWERAKEKFVIPFGDSETEPVPAEEYAEREDTDNFFECPKCGHPHFGKPDDCDCGAEYQWDE